MKFHAKFLCTVGKKEFNFSTMAEFMAWKDREEEATNTSYVRKQQTYHPVSEGIK